MGTQATFIFSIRTAEVLQHDPIHGCASQLRHIDTQLSFVIKLMLANAFLLENTLLLTKTFLSAKTFSIAKALLLAKTFLMA